MEFSRPKQRRQAEPALPMINVVFLLLIFFLISAQIVPPSPFDVSPPDAETTGVSEEDLRIYISSAGEIALSGDETQDIWDILATYETPGETRVLLLADAALAASDLARVLTELSSRGFTDIDLAVSNR